MKFIFPVFLLVLIQACTSCDIKGTTKCKKEYTFEIKLTLNPALDTFTLQDTIWIESTINRKLLDLTSGDSVFIDTFDFKINSGIKKFIPSLGTERAENKFSYVNNVGGFYVNNLSISKGQLIYEKGIYGQKLRFGMIPKEKGVFKIGFYLLGDNLRDVDFPEDCHVDIVEVFKKMNTGTNNNFHLVKDYYKEFFPDSDYNEDDFNHGAGYAFVVQ